MEYDSKGGEEKTDRFSLARKKRIVHSLWCKLNGETKSVLMYAGAQSQKRSNGITVMNWRELMNKEI